MRITESQEAEIRRAIQSTMNAILKWYNITTCSYSMDCLRGVNSTEQIGYKSQNSSYYSHQGRFHIKMERFVIRF